MNNFIIGLILINLYLLTLKEKKLKRLFTFSDLSYIFICMSFILNNYYLYPIAISLSVPVLLCKNFVLKQYKIKDNEDFVIHYFPMLILIYLLFNKKNLKYNIYYIIFTLLIFITINYSYTKISKKQLYNKFKYNTKGLINLILSGSISILIYLALQY